MKTIVVSGGTRGLGLAIVRWLLQADYTVIAIGRTITEDVVSLNFEYPSRFHFVPWDLADISTLTTLASKLTKIGSIYGLVNNAGISLSGILNITPTRSIEQTIALNITSPIMLTRALLGSMMVQRAGRIINISSIVASTGYPGLSVYSATKAALIGFTHSLAREVGGLNITVNAVAPGFLDTDMTNELTEKHKEQIKRRSALHAMATVDDVAATVKFLLSDNARHITGTTITVDAGNIA